MKLRPKILDLKPGTRIVSNTFDMDNWEPDETAEISPTEGCTSYCKAYLWIVPAKAAGSWKLPEGELTIVQTFQTITGTLKSANNTQAINGKLVGDRISFTAGGAQYSGRVSGDAMEGTGGSGGSWKASRVGK